MNYQKIFSDIPETIVVLSPEYKVLAATKEYLRVTMRAGEELIGKDFLEAFPDNPDNASSRNAALLRRSLDNALQTKKVDYLEVLRYDIPRPAAEGGGFDIRYWEASHTPVLDEKGEVLYIIQRTSDVTEREIAKLALSESEDKFKFVADAVPELLNTYNGKGESTYFNRRWVEYTGKPIKELLDEPWKELLHPEDFDSALARRQEAFSAGTPYQMELRLRDKAGSYRWFLKRCAPMQNEDNSVLLWVSSCSDIHDTRIMVQELLATNEQMADLSDMVQKAYTKAEAERKTLERLIKHAPAFFCILRGPEHRFELVNDKYQQLFPQRELIGKTVAEALPEIIDQGFIEVLDGVYTTGQDYKANDILVKLDQTGSGVLNDVYLTFIYQPIFNEEAQVNGILVFGYDTTSQVLIQQKLQNLEPPH